MQTWNMKKIMNRKIDRDKVFFCMFSLEQSKHNPD